MYIDPYSSQTSYVQKPLPEAPNYPTAVVPRRTTSEIIDAAKVWSPIPDKHSHYFKDVSHLNTIDVYRVLDLFGVTDQAIGHAIKKLLVAGGRGAGKDIERDIQEAVDTLARRLAMKKEDNAKV